MKYTELNKNEQPDALKGLIAGAVGGLVAAYVMSEFQNLWSSVSESLKESDGQNGERKGKQSNKEEQEPATVKAAEAISENVFDHELTDSEKKYAGPAVHYAMGAGSAAVYGVVSEFVPETRIGAGMPFGAMVWLIADEAVVPVAGLSKSPLEYPVSTHAYGLASHLVYGLTTEYARRTVRRVL